MNKRGQFYLIAALAILTLTAGFIIVSNKVSTVQNQSIGYLKDEISTEASSIINYGIANNVSEVKVESMLENLSYYYINATSSSNLYFMMGNASNVTLIGYQNYPANITLNGTTLNIGEGTVYKYNTNFTPPTNTITIKINSTSYTFSLNTGENFHFIIKSLSGGQDYTIED